MAAEGPDVIIGSPEAEPSQGKFRNNLKRNNKQIKSDRADSIAEDSEMGYERRVQDLRMEIKRLTRQRENMLDLSPENSYSLMLAGNFDSAKFINDDIKIGVELRNLEITVEIAERRFMELFGRIL